MKILMLVMCCVLVLSVLNYHESVLMTISTSSLSIRKEKNEPTLANPPRQQRLPYQEEDTKDQLHMVFSVSCNQGRRLLISSILQHSATAVGQNGPITQIISGCTDEERDALMKEPTFYYDFRRHFTPSYSPHPKPGIDDNYTPYNKPFALRHFLRHANPSVKHDVIALIDGDFVFFRPLEVNTGRNISKYYHGDRPISEVTDTVADGMAIAQDWSNYMGAGWFSPYNKEKLDFLCGTGVDAKPCANVTEKEGKEFYAGTGPPYIMTRHDMNTFVDDYCDFVVQGRKKTDDWMTEMYGYAVAAGNHGIKHTMLTNLGVTHPKFDTENREYWSFVDEKMTNPCLEPFAVTLPEDPPVGLHYCQNYGFVKDPDHGFHYYKYDLPDDLGDCDAPLLVVPPPSEWEEAKKISDTQKRGRKLHEVWAECTLVKIVNQAMIKLKERTCPKGFNTFHGTKLNH
jgi:hypothetical protein